jgi:Secretion system C-terminal sorting domain
MKNIPLILFLFQSYFATATIHQVGATRTYTSPNALYLANVVQDGDTIEIDAETYTGQAALAVWQSDNLLIRGIGGQPHLVADGQYIWGKGIWVFASNDITVENIEFSGATVPDQNGAGIRLDGEGLTARHCYFHDNENGILTSNPYAGDILIEFCEFAYNGYGDGYSHNLYIGHVNKLTFRFNYSHHAKIGHNLKSRANENYIYYNRIMDEETGNSSRLIDLPNGGLSIVMGNVLMQGDNAPNNNMAGYGKEGLSNSAPHELYFINNTMVNKRIASCRFLDIEAGTAVAHVSNNIFAGSGTVVDGTTTTFTNNLAETNIEALYFVDEPNYNYQLQSNAAAIDAGAVQLPVNGLSLSPDFIYVHPLAMAPRAVVDGGIDVGAYEYGVISSTLHPVVTKALIYPNPTNGELTIELEAIDKLELYNHLGQRQLSETQKNKIDLTELPEGIYFLKIESGRDLFFATVILQKMR